MSLRGGYSSTFFEKKVQNWKIAPTRGSMNGLESSIICSRNVEQSRCAESKRGLGSGCHSGDCFRVGIGPQADDPAGL